MINIISTCLRQPDVVNGPAKVAGNLIKELGQLGYPFVVNLLAARGSRKPALWVGTGLLVLVLSFGWSWQTIELSGGRLLSLDLKVMSQEPNWVGREARNLAAINYLSRHPWTGLGLGRPTAETGSELAYWVYNPYLHWGVAMGLPALMLFAAIMLLALRRAMAAARQPQNRVYHLGILLALGAWMINQVTTGDSVTYFHTVESTFYFYAILGLIFAGSNPAYEVRSLSGASVERSGYGRIGDR